MEAFNASSSSRLEDSSSSSSSSSSDDDDFERYPQLALGFGAKRPHGPDRDRDSAASALSFTPASNVPHDGEHGQAARRKVLVHCPRLSEF